VAAGREAQTPGGATDRRAKPWGPRAHKTKFNFSLGEIVSKMAQREVLAFFPCESLGAGAEWTHQQSSDLPQEP